MNNRGLGFCLAHLKISRSGRILAKHCSSSTPMELLFNICKLVMLKLMAAGMKEKYLLDVSMYSIIF